MSDVTYALNFFTSQGLQVGTVTTEFEFTIGKSGSEPAVLMIRLPSEAISASYLVPDAQIEVSRTGTDGSARTVFSTRFLLEKWTSGYNGNEFMYTLQARSAVVLLSRRVVNYFAASAQSTKTGAADDVIKAIVRENLGSSAGAGRNWSTYLSVDSDFAAAPSVSKSFAWRNVRNVIDDLCDASTQHATTPTRLFYDIVYSGGFLFKTYANQRGVDRRTTLQFQSAIGDVSDAQVTRDYSDTATYAIVAGQGEEASRNVVNVEDLTRYDGSPFARNEIFVDARQYSSSTGMSNEGAAALWEHRRRTTFSGKINTGKFEFTKDWDFGDRLYVTHELTQYECLIDSVQVRGSDGRETVIASLRSL